MKHIASFRPRFFEVFRGYSRQTFSADLMAGLVVGIVALPLAIAFGIASGVSPEKGNHHGRGRGVRRLAAGRKPGTDRRPYGCLHRHRLRRRPAIRRNGAAGCDVHGRRAAGRDGAVQTRRRHPVHSLSRRGGVHSRHRPDDFHDADRRPVRDEFRRGTRAGGFHRQVDALFPPFRFGQLGEPGRGDGQHPADCPYTQVLAPYPGVAGGHRRADGRGLGASNVCGHGGRRYHRRPLYDPCRIACRSHARDGLGGDAQPVPRGFDHCAAGGLSNPCFRRRSPTV